MTSHVNSDTRERTFTRRDFMVYRALIANDAARLGDVWITIEAVASWAIENPEVDMDEKMTWAEWESREGREK